MRHKTKLSWLFWVVLIASGASAQSRKHPNVVFIMVDDLRPDLHCYGNPVIHSPNIDMLAAEGCLFTKQYAVVPTCGASRCAILTGLLPRSTAALSNEACVTFLSGKPPTDDPRTFVANLKKNGYYTVGIGKISHYPDGYVYPYLGKKSNQLELPYSWDEMLLNPGKWHNGWNAFFGYADGTNRNALHAQVKPYEHADVSDEGYPDGLTADLAIRKLDELKKRKQPFFLAVGFFKPHLPFNAPEKYWDLYKDSEISLTPSPDIPQGINRASLAPGSGELNGYRLGDEKPTLDAPASASYSRELRHAYYACVSYADAQVGKVLSELKKSGLDKNTIVVLWSDHGWHLGDDRIWGKHTLFEWALRNVLIVKAPGMKKGVRTDAVVSSADIYPTLMELCHVPMPHKTDGKSFVPLLKRPGQSWNNVAYSYYLNGISMRTDRYRLTKYFRKQQPQVELYDHQVDPYENKNIASSHPEIVDSLMKRWEAGNTGLYQTSAKK